MSAESKNVKTNNHLRSFGYGPTENPPDFDHGTDQARAHRERLGVLP
jgi:hypothetical protein